MRGGNLTRWGVVLAGAVTAFSGCNCGTQENCTLTITEPAENASLSSLDQVVATLTRDSDNAVVAIDTATLTLAGVDHSGVVATSGVTFTDLNYMTPGASQQLTVTASAATCGSVSATRRFTITEPMTCGDPRVTALTFPQDGNGDFRFNSTELENQPAVTVNIAATCVGGMQVQVKCNGQVVGGPVNFVNDSATIPAVTGQGTCDLFAEILQNGVAQNTASTNMEATQSIFVDTTGPAANLDGTPAAFAVADDADPNTAGFQARIIGHGEGTCTVAVDAQTPEAVTLDANGDFSQDFTVEPGAHVATLSCSDSDGNGTTVSKNFTVATPDTTPPTVVITAPANVDGGATMTVTSSPLAVSFTTDMDVSDATYTVNGGMASPVIVSNGTGSFSVDFATDGTYVITVTATDGSGNVGSASLTVTVVLDGCGLSFTKPATCPALITAAQAPGGAYDFFTLSKPSCAGQPLTLYSYDVLADGGVGTQTQVGTATVAAGGTGVFANVPLTSGEYFFRGSVVDVGGSTTTQTAACRVTVDLDAPAITSPVQPTGQPYAVVNVAQDTQAGAAGVQRNLTFTGRIPVGGHAEVCTDQATDPVSMMARTHSSACSGAWFVLDADVASPVPAFTFPEGTYQVKVVIVGGSVLSESAPLPLYVDATRPCISGLALPQDINGDGKLNAAELGSAAPRVTFNLDPACKDLSTATLAATNPIVVKDVVSGAPGATRAATVSCTGATCSADLTGPFTEADLQLFFEITDLAGNKNVFATMNDPAQLGFRVDVTAPTCTINSPTQTLLGQAQVPGGMLNVQVGTSADVVANGVALDFTGQAQRTVTPVSNLASTTYALTGDATYTINASCTDGSGNTSTASPRTLRVDLIAPTCDITAPADGTVSGTNDLTTTVALTGITEATTVTLTSSVSGITGNVFSAASGATTVGGTVHYPNGTQTVTVSATDSAGNACVAPSGGHLSISLTINSTSCNLDFAAAGSVVTNAQGTWVNRASAGLPVSGSTPASATVNVGVVTSDCGAGKTVSLYPGAPVHPPTGTTATTNGSGAATFTGFSVNEGAQYSVTIDNGAGIYTDRTFVVSLQAPTVASIALQRSATVTTPVSVPVNAALVFGAASGNRRVETATAGDLVFGDLDAATNDAQFNLSLGAIDGARVNGLSASLNVLEGTTSLLASPIAVDATPYTPTLPILKLGHRVDDTATSLVIRVTSPAGNVWESTHSSQVDVIAPAIPVITSPSVTSSRLATISVTWAPVYDDAASAASGGLTGGSPSAGYDIRWSTSSVPGNNGLATTTDFFGTSAKAEAVEPWSASNITRAISVPPINTYYVAVRARDEVGNYSAYAAPTSLSNPWSTTVITGGAGSSFGGTVIAADVVGSDGLPELIVGASGATGGGAVFVYGNTSLTASTVAGCPAGCQQLAPPDGTNFANDVTVGNVGAVAAETKQDLVVAQLLPSFTGGRVVLYYGTTAATLNTADSIEFRGDATNRVGYSAAVLADITGDGRDELAIAAPLFSSNRGRVFIYKGRDKADWTPLLDTSGATPFIPISTATADYVIDGPFPLLSTGNSFGQTRRGLVSVTDLDGDGFPDVGIPTARSTINRYRVYGSATIKGTVAPAVLDGTSSYRLELTAPVATDASITSGIGAAVVSNRDFVDSTARDLLASFPSAPGGGQIFVYSAIAAPTTPTINPSSTLITGPLSFGQNVSVGDLDGDAHPEIASGTFLSADNHAWVIYQHGGAFETGTLGSTPMFWATDFSGTAITGSSSSRLGLANTLSDVSGDGLADVVLGDTTSSAVRIWR